MWFNSRQGLSRPEHVYGPPTGPPLRPTQKLGCHLTITHSCTSRATKTQIHTHTQLALRYYKYIFINPQRDVLFYLLYSTEYFMASVSLSQLQYSFDSDVLGTCRETSRTRLHVQLIGDTQVSMDGNVRWWFSGSFLSEPLWSGG